MLRKRSQEHCSFLRSNGFYFSDKHILQRPYSTAGVDFYVYCQLNVIIRLTIEEGSSILYRKGEIAMESIPLKLRPHHGICIPFFTGHGYSSEFVEHLSCIQNNLNHNPSQSVLLCDGTDCVCAACPENRGAVCKSAQKVAAYDRNCLRACGLEFGAVLSWNRFRNLVRKNILLKPAVREKICCDCLWNSICQQQDVD